MVKTIYASFREAENAEKAVGALLDHGVRAEDINVVTSHNPTVQTVETKNDGTVVKTVDSPSEDLENAAKAGLSTTTGADAGAGAVKGIGWGAALGIVAGIAALAVPGVGIVLGGGALATALGGVVATAGAGAAAGAVTGYLVDQGVEMRVAEDYEKQLAAGGAFLSVFAPSGMVGEVEIRSILYKYGAATEDVFSTAYVA